jgi:4-hydroxybenzoate polyprenyltransferase
MISRSTFLHLRLPFSLFLLPIYLFALAISNNPSLVNIILVFLIMHIFLYPASNAYNSYFDKDEGSIGALKNPPRVSRELYFTALTFDLIAILLGFLISWQFVVMIFIYGLVSKAYSHPMIRLKRLPYTSWFVAGFFQGCFSFIACYIGMNDGSFLDSSKLSVLFPALLSSMLLWGSYPMTQIYQHEEDSKRGDITMSFKLGIIGTFHFTAAFFGLSVFGFFIYFKNYFGTDIAIWFLVFLAPMAAYFGFWYLKVLKDNSSADFSHTMRLNLISSICFSVFFLWISLA